MADPDLSESSLGSWADECERANAALAAAEDQMGRTGEGHETDASLAAAEARMEKEDREWLAALEAAMALLHPRQQGPENQPPNKGRATRQKHQPPLPNGVRGTKEGTPAVKPGDQAVGEFTTRSGTHCPSSTEGEVDEIQVVGVY